MWVIFGLLSALFSALMSISIKTGLKEMNPILSLFTRTFIVTIFCFIACLINKSYKDMSKVVMVNWKGILLTSVFTFLTWLFYFLAMKTGSAHKVMALDKLSIIITIIYMVLFTKESINASTIIGSILIILGSIFLLLK